MKRVRSFLSRRCWRAVPVFLLFGVAGCYLRDVRWTPIRPPPNRQAKEVVVETTGYCPCGECCNWERNWLLQPVIASGPNEGKSKAVGITASGRPARHGTLAADTTIFPFGTVIYVPGYGYGVVEDRGGDIKGYKLDLYFPSHAEAKRHGRVKHTVKVWLP